MSRSIEQFFGIFSGVFVLFGISHTIPTSLTSRNLSKSTLWMGFISLVLLTALLVLFHYHDMLLADTGALSTSISAYQLISPIVCHLVLIAESLFSVAVMDRMWSSVAEIEDLIQSSGVDVIQNNSKFYRKYILKFVFSQLIPITIETFITVSSGIVPAWQRHWISKTFSFNANRVAVMHHILWVDYLTSRGDFISQEMNSLNDFTKKVSVKPVFDRYSFSRIGNLKKIHQSLWRLTQEVNERFKLLILATLTNNLLNITIDLYWIYGNFRFGGNPLALRELFHFLLLCLFYPLYGTYGYFRFGLKLVLS